MLPIAGANWETLDRPDCWDEDFGNIDCYSEEYTFIVGRRTKDDSAYLIYNQPNEAIHVRRLSGFNYPVHFAAVQATDLCLAPLGSNRITATFNWRTRRLSTGAVGRCS